MDTLQDTLKVRISLRDVETRDFAWTLYTEIIWHPSGISRDLLTPGFRFAASGLRMPVDRADRPARGGAWERGFATKVGLDKVAFTVTSGSPSLFSICMEMATVVAASP